MGANESLMGDPYAVHYISDVQPAATNWSTPSALVNSVGSASLASSRSTTATNHLPEEQQQAISNIIALVLAGSCWPSTSSAVALSHNLSPLLTASDSGLSGVLAAIFKRGGNNISSVRALRSKERVRIRPRILGIFPPSTVRDASTGAAALKTSIKLSDKSADEFRCPICLDIFERPIVTSCRHAFCVECMISSLAQQSLCPLCRAPAYTAKLRSLADEVADVELQRFYTRYLSIAVQCPKCLWTGQMHSWEAHALVECRDNAEVASNIQLKTNDENSGAPSPWKRKRKRRHPPDTFRNSAPSTRNSAPFTRNAAASSTRNIIPEVCANEIAVDPTGTVELPSLSLSPSSRTCPSDKLACWLLDEQPGAATKLYVVVHRMENVMGALVGSVCNGVHHAQAILEFTDHSDDFTNHPAPEPSWLPQPCNPQPPVGPCGKTFISLELFGDRPGLEWEISDSFPDLKYTAKEISVYGCGDSGLSTELLVEFLLSCRHKKYSLLGWNCKKLIVDLKKKAGITWPPITVREIPAQRSYSESLQQLLLSIIRSGSLPILSSNQNLTPPDAIPQATTSSKWTSALTRFRSRRSSPTPASSPVVVPALSVPLCVEPAGVRVRSVTMCLFPAEDHHRSSLRPAARVSGLLSRTLDLARPASARSRRLVAQPINMDNSSREVTPLTTVFDSPQMASDCVQNDFDQTDRLLTDAQIRLRYRTHPVLVFHVQSSNIQSTFSSSSSSSKQPEEWNSVCYLSIEFCSCGLLKHVYNEFPPGLHQSAVEGGTDFVLTCQTSFPLQSLLDALKRVQDREYNPTSWSGWEFVETILHCCCPSVAPHLLLPPVPEIIAYD